MSENQQRLAAAYRSHGPASPRTIIALTAGLLIAALLALVPGNAVAQDNGAFQIHAGDRVVSGVETSVTVQAPEGAISEETAATLRVDGRDYPLTLGTDGQGTAEGVIFSALGNAVSLEVGGQAVTVSAGGETGQEASISALPGFLSILPPIIAILLALITKRVIPSLVIGVWAGAWFSSEFSLAGIWYGLLDVIDTWVLRALVPEDGGTGHMSIMLFTMLIGAMVGIIYRNGGTQAIVDRLTAWATTRRRGEVAAGAVGTAIFFDDYSSLLVHGNAVRPMTDRLKISREKLAYIVDTCSAPIATWAFITTWIGFQVGLIADATANIAGVEAGPYAVFFASIPYMFYPLLAFLFMWLLIGTGRDWGPMARAQDRALGGDVGGATAEQSDRAGLTEKEGVERKALNAVIPIAVLLGVTIIGLFVTGSGDTLMDVIGSADSFTALLWGSLLAVLVAVVISVGRGLLSLGESVESGIDGIKAVFDVLVILTLAWALSAVTENLQAANWLASMLGQALPAALMPAILFVIAAAIAFATGTSWGTMGILLPLAIPLTWTIMGNQGLAGTESIYILYGAVGATLAGAVWGDHTSPISDTTVLASATSHCGVVEHTNTQLPYGILVGAVALLLGYLPAGYGLSAWLSLAIGFIALVVIVLVAFRVPESSKEAAA
ncbi:MAG TPA: Na+/H+ antiporter NhaC family protein [Arenicellales bacterium]|nr:Na+/H+ antiporter NhaC family protein [Arenicellales bacterium]